MRELILEARKLRDEGDLPKASLLLQKAHSENPQDPRIWKEQALVLMRAKKYKESLLMLTSAHQAFEIAEGLTPKQRDKKDARTQRAQTAEYAAISCASMGEYELALNWLEVATELYPKDKGCSAWQFKGSMLYLHGKPVDGFLAHDKALSATEDDAQARFNKALVLMLRGDPKGWDFYESRLDLPHCQPHRRVDLPRWEGA